MNGVDERIPHTGLSRQIDNTVEPPFSKQLLHSLAIGQIHLHKPEVLLPGQPLKPCLFERHIVVVVHIVNSRHPVAPFQKPAGNIGANKTGSAGNKYFH